MAVYNEYVVQNLFEYSSHKFLTFQVGGSNHYRDCQCDVRVPTRWRLSLFLWLLHWRVTTELWDVLRLTRNRVRVMVGACHAERECPQDGGWWVKGWRPLPPENEALSLCLSILTNSSLSHLTFQVSLNVCTLLYIHICVLNGIIVEFYIHFSW